MCTRIICPQYNLRSPRFPPTFFPHSQTEVKRPVLISIFSPRFFRKISRTFIGIIQCTGISHFQPRKESNVNVIIKCIFHIEIIIMQWDYIQYITTKHKSLVPLHFCRRCMKQSGRTPQCLSVNWHNAP